jgi:hypothetical protein
MIWTGYFARYKIYQQAGLKPISIAKSSLQGVQTLKAEWLAPGSWIYDWKNLVKRTGGDKELIDYYIKRYTKENLAHLSHEEVLERLDELAYHSDAVLLCYEALPKGYNNQGIVKIGDLLPGSTFCHRHIVSEFMRSGGLECREYIASPSELKLLKKDYQENESGEDMFA